MSQQEIVQQKGEESIKPKKKERKQRDTREEKAQKMLLEGKVIRIVRPEEVYKVESESKPETFYKVYVRNLKVESCTCPDFSRRFRDANHRCKHMRLVELAHERSHVKMELASTELSYKSDEYGF